MQVDIVITDKIAGENMGSKAVPIKIHKDYGAKGKFPATEKTKL